jgi:uncharacterized membrane protein (DUF485 family)
MVLHDHAQADEPEDAVASARNARIGRKLFIAYLALYVGYVWLVAFRPDLMAKLPWGGVNTAVLYGFGLIVAALVTALVYGLVCRTSSNTTEGQS